MRVSGTAKVGHMCGAVLADVEGAALPGTRQDPAGVQLGARVRHARRARRRDTGDPAHRLCPRIWDFTMMRKRNALDVSFAKIGRRANLPPG